MELLRERLEPLMLAAIRQSKFTNNDATRLLVRSRETPEDPMKYTIEYVQAALSLEKKLVVMLYDEGTETTCFRKRIAMGRRNWQQAGSHFAAQNMSRSCHVTMFAIMRMARMLSSLSMLPKVKE